MKLRVYTILIVATVLGLAGCGQRESPSPPRVAAIAIGPRPRRTAAFDCRALRVIGPAVAGMFYPRHEKDLAAIVNKLLANAKGQKIEHLRGLVCPPCRLSLLRQDGGHRVQAGGGPRVSHRDYPRAQSIRPFRGRSFLPAADAMETPLGLVCLSPKVAELAKKAALCRQSAMQGPAPPIWWQESPQRELPGFGEDTPFSWEHSVEVQVPFLQRVLADFRVAHGGAGGGGSGSCRKGPRAAVGRRNPVGGKLRPDPLPDRRPSQGDRRRHNQDHLLCSTPRGWRRKIERHNYPPDRPWPAENFPSWP